MKSIQFSGFILVAVAVLFVSARPDIAEGGTNVVTTTSDSGAGSLRQAITAANLITSGANLINFNISGPGPFTIIPATALPTVTNHVIIDGYTQPGASQNTLTNGDDAVLKIFLKGKLIIDTTNSVVRGLAMLGIDFGAVQGPKGSNIVEGCFVGLDTSGTNSPNDPDRGVFVQTPRNRIGGTSPASRNIISGNGATGIEVFDVFATNTLIQGNFIGTDRTGTKAIGNVDRAVVINMMASAATIGGTAAGAGNLISGNLNRGVVLDGPNNIVQGNLIGTDITGTLPLGNARSGVEIGGTNNLVGGTNSGTGNIIAFNGVDGQGSTTNGVDIKDTATNSVVLGNTIYDNLGLGIDVGMDELITKGFPVLTVASNTGTATFIKGTNAPTGTFRLELFVNVTPDPSGFGEGKFFLGGTNVTTDGTGNFSLNWPTPVAPGLFVTATGNGITEFSSNRVVVVAGGVNRWTNSLGGKWETGPNWSLGIAPYITQSSVLITNATTKTVTSDVTTATSFPSTLTISNLSISAPTGATNTLLLAHGGTGTPLRVLQNLAVNKGGALVVSNSALSVEGTSGTPMVVDGAVTLAGGALNANNSINGIIIGNSGSGALNVSGGNLLAFAATVGGTAGSDSVWRIAGGTNFLSTTLDIANTLLATGTVSMAGGQLTVPTVYVGSFGNGRLVVSNGLFQCLSLATIGSSNGAQGSFTAVGGTNVFNDLLIGEAPQATGAVLVAGTAYVQVNDNVDNRGAITVAGGTLNMLGEVDSVETNNAILVTGGQFAATNGSSFLTRVTVSNGTFLARDVFLGNSRAGTFSLAGGVVGAPGSFNGFNVGVNGGTGTVSQVGGLINLTNTDLNIGGLFSPAVGQMTISNGTAQANQVFVGGQGDGNGTLLMAGGTLITPNLFVNPTSRLLFNKGLVQTFSTTASSTPNFVVGDNTNVAELNLLGGTNTFTTGLRVASNSLVTGSGTIAGNVTNAGVIAPGPLFARLNIKGNVVLSNSSDLRVDIGGYTPTTQFDFITVASNTTLGGKLSVSITNNFQSTMTNGASFTVLTNGTTLTGAFANVPSGGTLTSTEGYARFTVLYAGANTVRLTGLTVVDSDNDGLPDWWEDLYGLNKNDPSDAALDSDGDGQSNLDEFRAGTLPNNPSSFFHITAFTPETNNVRITWTTVGGKNYRVQTNAPVNGNLTTNFNDLSPLISVGGAGESTTNYLHVGGATNAAARYYRVRVVP